MVGSKNPAWRGGHKYYRGFNWKQQRTLARKRDEDTCQHCRSKEKVQVHHKRPYYLFDTCTEANDLNNLITLCPRCHSLADCKFWKDNPDLIGNRHLPESFMVICRSCGRKFHPNSPASKVCIECCTCTCRNCGRIFKNRKAAFRDIVYCSRKCRNEYIYIGWQWCACGSRKHHGANRCRKCDTDWYRNNPSAPRRGVKPHNKPLSIN